MGKKVHDWFSIYPEGLRKHLNWLKQQYGDLDYKIMEIGYLDTNPTLIDVGRVKFLKEHMEQTLLAIGDGVNVSYFTVWSLLDNFEWMEGYSSKFGLYNVDFNSTEFTRVCASVIEAKSLDGADTKRILGRVTDEL